jgi:hypothetical protein
MAQLAGQPVVILPEGTQRYVGRDAQRLNILAARILAETVRTTLGPKGMDKMLVDSLGDIVITNDGATILDEMDIQHPAAKMMVEVAKTQDKEHEAKVRHLTDELKSLEEYKEHHPGDSHDPTSLELHCEANPDAEECRVYDD